jgi:heme exporter protein C
VKIVKLLSIVLISFVLFAGIAVPMVPQPHGLFQFPIIPGLENKARNIFFHVPLAWTAVLAFLIALWHGFRYLRTQDIMHDHQSLASAGLGLMFCLLATVTGSIWARFNWGSFWNWDPRETSIFILLLIYGAYFALRSALASEEIRARLSAVYSMIAGVTAPFFVFVMPRLFTGLHPGARGDEAGSTPVAQLHMTGPMRIVFFCGLLGFSLLFFWLLNLRVRIARLQELHSINLQQ